MRDALSRRPVLDTDATLSAGLDRIARALEAAGMGRAVPLSESNPRAIRIAGRRTLDLIQAEGGSIERDLARRDFTVNALALDLSTGALLDPHGGREDLRRGRLRLLSEENLAEDPLRTLRAARFIATHGLRPDGATERACRSHAAGLSAAAPERVMVELRRILEAPRSVPALRWAARNGVLGPALGIPLDLRAASRLSRRLAALDSPAVRRETPEARGLLRLASLSAAFALSPGAAGGWLRALRQSRDLAGEIARLRELAEAARRARGDDAAWTWVRDAGARWRNALLLLRILHSGSGPVARRLSRRARRARRRPRIRGADVLAWTGVPPGPRVGDLLARMEVEVLRGRVRTRAAARQWLLGKAPRQTTAREPNIEG